MDPLLISKIYSKFAVKIERCNDDNTIVFCLNEKIVAIYISSNASSTRTIEKYISNVKEYCLSRYITFPIVGIYVSYCTPYQPVCSMCEMNNITVIVEDSLPNLFHKLEPIIRKLVKIDNDGDVIMD